MRHEEHTLALLPWGNVFEDFLDGIGLSVADFCNQVSGGWLFNYVTALQRHGWRVVIILVSREADQVYSRLHRATGVPIYVLPASRRYRQLAARMQASHAWTAAEAFGPNPRPLRAAAELLRMLAPYLATPVRPLSRVLRNEGCTALMVQEYEYARFDICVTLGRLLGIPVFGTFQGSDRHNSRLESALRPLALKFCAGVVAGSRAEIARLQARYELPPEKVAHIGNPIDLETWNQIPRLEARRMLGLTPAARIAIWHGRIDIHRKGLDLLINAWRRVTAARPGLDARLVLIGSGTDDDRLAAMLDAAPSPGVEWNRSYVLDRDLMARWLSAADVYVMLSRVEGFAVAPLEAMACGLPIVAPDIHGIRDILVQGESSGGILMPCTDPGAAAAALIRLMDDRELSLSLGRKARRTVERRFSLDAVGRDLSGFLNRRIGHLTTIGGPRSTHQPRP